MAAGRDGRTRAEIWKGSGSFRGDRFPWISAGSRTVGEDEMKIALLEPLGVKKELIDELAAPIRAEGHEFVYYDQKTTDPEELKKRSAGCEAVMIANNPYPDAVIEACEGLKMINVAFTGIDHVGREAAKKRGLLICNAANYSNQTVAELVIGMALSMLRHIPEVQERLRSGGTKDGLVGTELRGKTVGIIGYGRIGRRTGEREGSIQEHEAR